MLKLILPIFPALIVAMRVAKGRVNEAATKREHGGISHARCFDTSFFIDPRFPKCLISQSCVGPEGIHVHDGDGL